MHANKGTKSNARLIAILSLVVVGMFGFGFALVPLYSVFCELTGLNGKTGRIAVADAESQPIDKHRTVTIEFVTSLNQNMNLEFRPNQTKLHIHPGELYTTSFYARNRTGHYMVGRAIPSVAPGLPRSNPSLTAAIALGDADRLTPSHATLSVPHLKEPSHDDRHHQRWR